MKKNLLSAFFIFSAIVFTVACTKDYSFEKPVDLRVAKGRLTDTSGNCYESTVVGTFYNGVTPGPDTAYVEMQVWVDSVGNYVIKTLPENGFMFSDSGFFNTTGINTIKLKPSGTPILQKTTDFLVSFDTTVCSFSVVVNDSTGTGLGGNPGGNLDSINNSDTAWYFSDANRKYNGPVLWAEIAEDSTTGSEILLLVGLNVPTGDSAIVLTIPSTGGVITPGHYTTDDGLRFAFISHYITDPTVIYSSDGTTSDDNMNLDLQFDALKNIVLVTFSGTAVDTTGNAVEIKNGKFQAVLSP